MAARSSTPDDILGGAVEETAVSAVLGYEPAVVVREYRWDGYGALDEETRAFVRVRTDQVHDGEEAAGRGMVRMGQALVEVKDRLEHGQWGAWVASEFAWGMSQAQTFMRAAKAFRELPAGVRISASALGLLASPSVSEELRDEVIQLSIEEPVTIIRTKEMIAAEKRQREVESQRRDLAVNVVMTWYTKLPEKQRAEAIILAETPKFWRTLRPYGQEADLDDSEVRAAVKYVRANLKALVQQWGGKVSDRLAAKAAGETGNMRGIPPAARPKERAPEQRPTGSWSGRAESDGEDEERPVRVVDEWIEVGVVEQEVLREVLGRDVTVTDAGELVIPVVGGWVTFAAAVSGKDTVIVWRLDRG